MYRELPAMRGKSKRLKIAIGVVLIAITWLGVASANLASADDAPPSAVELSVELGKDPNNANLHYLKGNEYSSIGDYARASMEYKKCVELQPRSPAGKSATEALMRLRSYNTAFNPNANSGGQAQAPAPLEQTPTQLQYAPKIFSLDVNDAPPGDTLHITGTGLGVPRNELIVTINGLQASVVSASSSYSIDCIIPAIVVPTDNVPVVVRTTYGCSNTLKFNVGPVRYRRI